MKPFAIVVAVDDKSGIGKNGGLPWRSSADMKHFKTVTTQGGAMNAVIMGRKTWESLPDAFRPLPNRRNIVVTRNPDYSLPDAVLKALSFDDALKAAAEVPGEVFVIGGSEIFRLALMSPFCEKIYLTRLAGDFQCDALFPPLPKIFRESLVQPPVADGPLSVTFCEYIVDRNLR